MKAFFCVVATIATAAMLMAAAPAPMHALQPLMEAQKAPGMELVVVDGGKVVTNAAYGVRNLDSQDPVDVHTRFEIGSITKQFTAAAILQLEERGKLSLDDTLGKYVPEYPVGKAITIRQLLLQVSGIPNYTETKAFTGLIAQQGQTVVLKRKGDFASILTILRGKPLAFAPGTRWEYSNSNYVLLGRVVEVVSGMPWHRYIAKNIFAPAGMTESSFMEDESNIADMATGYTTYKGKLRPTGTFAGWAGAAGSIVSTASDLAKWDAALLGGKLLSADDVRAMTAPGPLPALGSDSRYGYGWVIDRYDGQNRIWHNGGTLGFASSNQIYPALGQEIITLINNGDGSADAIADATFDRLHPELAAAKSRAAPGEDLAVTARAKALWAQFVSGSIDRTQFDASMNKALTPELIAGAKAQFAPLGSATSWVFRGKSVAGEQTSYTYYVTFSSGTSLIVHMTLGKDGKVSGYLAGGT